jgi:NAD-dependent DNA ligase
MSLDRIQGLRKSLHDHNFRYYVSDNPIISDFEFDKLLFELSELEQKILMHLIRIALHKELVGR